MSETNLASIDPTAVCDLLKAAGFRADVVNDPSGIAVIRSATGGLNFEIQFNRSGNGAGFSDATFVTGLMIQGELPLAVVNRWNASRRFARLFVADNRLLMQMDVSFAGGVSTHHVRMALEVWDRLVQELVPFLRAAAGELGASAQNSPAVEPKEQRFGVTSAI
jgi:hypothetical protein